VLESLATPGHDAAAVTFYDPWTGFLLTGDTVYRGRLYISDWPEFGRTIDRLAGFAARRDVTHVLGCHIEMTTQPGTDYPVGTTCQPDEPPLEMQPAHLLAVQAALAAAGPVPARRTDRDFILWPQT
jgi:hydroxyacylglutathione hydrolase